ncbi:MAG TPA: long-chain-fatty-acid--CoA ligase [Elusimicrobia bacterium]|nr:long-chain-fatty-acid--CoA ligase [Elusimicrobiota bacterium]
MTVGNNLNDLLDLSARERHDETALVFPAGRDTPHRAGIPFSAVLGVPVGIWTGERRLTFSELNGLVHLAAAAFRGAGIGPGDRVAIVHRNAPAFVIAYFGLMRIGAVAVPINFLIRKAEELRFMLGHCGAKGVVTQREFLEGLTAARRELPGLLHIWDTDASMEPGIECFWDLLLKQDPAAAEAPYPPVDPEATACILYTSGTTGEPKGVMLSHANLVSNCDAAIRSIDLRAQDTMLTLLPMFHTFAWTVCVLLALRVGMKNVLAPSITPPNGWLRQMGRHGVTLFVAVPQLYALLARQAHGLTGLALKHWFFRRVRLCVSGAAPLSPQTFGEFRAAFHCDILEGYGLTETSPIATVGRPGTAAPGKVGPPIEGVSVRICDDAGRELPQGEEGEIQIRGPNVMKGYFDDPAATAAVLADGWFKTGDIGALEPDGQLSIRDRKKDMIIVKGLKVFPAQIEAVLLSHPAVEEAAVIGVPDETGDEHVKAFLVLKKDAPGGPGGALTSVKQLCRERFDSYKRPRELEILAALPKNALQKVLKRELRRAETEKRRGAA